MNVFNLPDLGEGLPDAEIVQWHIAVGDTVKTDQILAEVQTAKAIVEIPSPYDGEIAILHGDAGDIIETGTPLITFTQAKVKDKEPEPEPTQTAAPAVGSMSTSDAVVAETSVSAGGISVSPEVRALARKLKVDLHSLPAKNGTVSLADVEAAAGKQKNTSNHKPAAKPARAKATPRTRAKAAEMGVNISNIEATGDQDQVTADDVSHTQSNYMNSTYHYPQRTIAVTGEPEPIRGDRRAMAQGMAHVRDTVVHTTIFDSCNIHAWPKKTDITTRVIRAMIAACMVEPALNAWFDDEKLTRTQHQHVNMGIAVDSVHGLSVPVIKNAEQKTGDEIRADLNRLVDAVISRTVRQDELTGATITLTNFGMIAGTFATPVISPPEVAILGIGRIKGELELTDHGIEKVRHLPLSLSFDHRAVTGGDAARFLAAILADLSLPY